jgi:dTDP-4-amino-4,6-dideoxygalactose transaminase
MRALIDSGQFVLGPALDAFEDEFARYSGAAHCVGMGNGGDAIELMLLAAGVERDDEVILPANTFVATALAVHRIGAVPVLVDSDPDHHLIDAGAVAARMGPRTRAIVGVHLYGQMAPMERLAEIAAGRDVAVVADAAQSQGARRHGRPMGAWGDLSTSFYPGKNLGAYGDGGAVLTDDSDRAARLRRLRNYGSDRKYEHPEVGYNSRLDPLQAVVLSAKLARLNAWNDQRRAAAARYDELLDGLPVQRPAVAAGNEAVWHLYVVRVPERDRVLASLRDAGIEASVHYPKPVHLQGAFAHLGHGPGDFPVAERAAGEILSLPIYPGITEAQQEAVVEALRTALRA